MLRIKIACSILFLFCSLAMVSCGVKKTVLDEIEKNEAASVSHVPDRVEVTGVSFIVNYTVPGYFVAEDLVVADSAALNYQCYGYFIGIMEGDTWEDYPARVVKYDPEDQLLLLEVEKYRCTAPMGAEQMTELTVTGEQLAKLLDTEMSVPDYLAYADVLDEWRVPAQKLGYLLGSFSWLNCETGSTKDGASVILFHTDLSKYQLGQALENYQTYLEEKYGDRIESTSLNKEDLCLDIELKRSDMTLKAAWQEGSSSGMLFSFYPGAKTESVMIHIPKYNDYQKQGLISKYGSYEEALALAEQYDPYNGGEGADAEKAIAIYEELLASCERPVFLHYEQLGRLYEWEEQDYLQAIDYYVKGRTNRNVAYHLGRMFADGTGVARNYNLAILFWMGALETDIPSDPEELREVDWAYINFFREGAYKEKFHSLTGVRYEFAYLDEDDYPELFMSEGSGTGFTFHMYRYDQDAGKVEYVNAFSQQGRVRYLEGEKRIISSYGNHGDYMTLVSELNGDKLKLQGAVRSCGMLGQAYYIDFPLPDTMQGQYDTDILSMLPTTDENYRVSRDEYEKRYGELVNERTVRTISYNEMWELPVEREQPFDTLK